MPVRPVRHEGRKGKPISGRQVAFPSVVLTYKEVYVRRRKDAQTLGVGRGGQGRRRYRRNFFLHTEETLYKEVKKPLISFKDARLTCHIYLSEESISHAL